MRKELTLHQWCEAMEQYIEESHAHVDPAVLNEPTALEDFVEDFTTWVEFGGIETMVFTDVTR